MAASKGIFVISLVIFFLFSVSCLPEPGKKALYFNTNHTYRSFSKTMNKGYSIAIKGLCKGYSGKIQINWRLEISECAERFSFLKDNDEKDLEALWNIFANYSLNGKQEVDCNSAIHLRDLTNEVKELIIPPTLAEESQSDDSSNTDKKSHDSDSTESIATSKPIKTTSTATATEAKTTLKTKNRGSTSTQVASSATTNDVNDVQNRKRRSEEEVKPISADGDEKRKKTDKVKVGEKPENKKEDVTEPSAKTPKEEKVDSQVCVTRRDGVYLLIVNALAKDEKHSKKLQLTLNVEMKSKHGYLSAFDWPLYPFYGCMSLLYVFYGIVWLIVSAFQWRDLLRIQFWIGGVICLGMLEKAVFFSEYNNINITGETNPSLTIFAELVSCVKRTLARILVIIVSMGFGIVKPRLGATLHRVLGVGALYFILAAVEGCFRSLHPKSDPGRQQLIASVPLAVLDASICWWIFMSLVQTTRTLRIRRNLIKLSLYRHFTNTLIFAVLASVAYMIWSIKTHRFAKDGCITDWSELWLDEAFWHFLFSIVLLVIMVLWRPTANNQRYAFTPIVDFGDDDEDDDNMTLSEAFDGMKMRNVKNVPEVHINGDSKRKHKPEDDLKWVEENIPSSVADTVLPSVLDSDEELMTTKFEISKME